MPRVAAAGILLLGVFAIWPAACFGQGLAGQAIEHDFGKKVLMVRTSAPRDERLGAGLTPCYLRKVQVRRLAGRAFLVGEMFAPPETKNPYEDAKIWVPLDLVLEMAEFESAEAVLKMYKDAPAQLPKAPSTAP